MAKPLHPIVQEAIVIGARTGARVLAGAATSLLREVGLGARTVQKKAVKAEEQIKKKLEEFDDEDDSDEE